MHVSPRFSGVYLRSDSDSSRVPSRTGYANFEYDGNSYYTTDEDTVTLRRAKQDIQEPETLTDIYRELAAKVKIEVPTLASMAAKKLQETATKRTLPKNVLERILPKAVLETGNPQHVLRKRPLDELEQDQVDIGIKSNQPKDKIARTK